MLTHVRSKWIRSLSIGVMGLTGFWLTSGLGCGTDTGVGGTGGGGSSDTPTGAILQPTSNVTLENGQSTNIQYFAQSPLSAAKLDVYLDRDSTRGNGNEVDLINGIDVPAGTGGASGSLTFNSTNVPNATYYVFGQIHYGDGLAQTQSFVSAGAIVVAPVGTQPQPQKPTVIVDEPTPNLGLASQDVVTVQYRYTSPSAPATITLVLDVDRDPTNDDISHPGDPNDPNVKVIVLPSTARDANDPTFGGDPPPPDNPNNPPTNVDSVEIRKNPRQLPATTSGLPAVTKVYRFKIDFARIPPRSNGQPYYIRAVIQVANGPQVSAYATGSLTISQLASGTVNLADVGFRVAGARFQGFSVGENLGFPAPLALGDIDQDTIDDFMLASRYGSPRNRFQTGAAYLTFGRSKVPFPPDTNGNGLPDVRDQNGNVQDYPTPPTFIYNPAFAGNISPYDPRVVGRFGGRISVNSIGTLAAGSFYRGTTYLMPSPRFSFAFPLDVPPMSLSDPLHPGIFTSGLTSIARVDLTGDAGTAADPLIRDFVFGIPFISNPAEYHDDDPCDKQPQAPPAPPGNIYLDFFPNEISTPTNVQPRPTDDMFTGVESGRTDNPAPIDTGLMIMVNGANDLANQFRQFVDAGIAGQFDQNGVVDDEGFAQGGASIPLGMRTRGLWETQLDPNSGFGQEIVAVPTLDNDLREDFLLSAPNAFSNRGAIYVFLGQNFTASGYYADTVLSIPSYVSINCGNDPPIRGFVVQPGFVTILGKATGDHLSHPKPAGDINQDGPQDILCGAPGADRNGLSQVGVFYILFNPAGGFGQTDLNTDNPPRLEIVGTHNNDRFGEMQERLGDINGDGIPDVAFASKNYTKNGKTKCGYVGVIFGNRQLTGELGFGPEAPGTSNLPGLRFFGTNAGDQAGTFISSAGDFNRDGYGDFMITCPGEKRLGPDGIVHDGVAYLILGGPRFLPGSPQYNGPEYTLDQVGTSALPGLVLLSPYQQNDPNEIGGTPSLATANNYPVPAMTVAGVGDVDGDGFDDITVGLPYADFVFDPNSPTQRRKDAGDVYLIYGSPLQ